MNKVSSVIIGIIALALLTLGVLILVGVPATSTSNQAFSITHSLRGDDNHDGRIDEDESGWNCHTMGNRICGPNVR